MALTLIFVAIIAQSLIAGRWVAALHGGASGRWAARESRRWTARGSRRWTAQDSRQWTGFDSGRWTGFDSGRWTAVSYILHVSFLTSLAHFAETMTPVALWSTAHWIGLALFPAISAAVSMAVLPRMLARIGDNA